MSRETETGFVLDLHEHPQEDGPRLIYADWLEDRGDEQSLLQAEYLRLGVQRSKLRGTEKRQATMRLRQLSQQIDPNWLASVSCSPIENCRETFEFECPQRWDRLTWTEDASVRFCESCKQNVYHCSSVAEARTHARQGHCVALECNLFRRNGDLVSLRRMGRYRPRDLRG